MADVSVYVERHRKKKERLKAFHDKKRGLTLDINGNVLRQRRMTVNEKFDRNFSVVEMWMDEGKSTEAIARHFSVTPQRVNSILRAAGIPVKEVIRIRTVEKHEKNSKLILLNRKSVGERFLEKVQKTGSCWLWKASVDPNGYGKFCYFHKGKSQSGYAHRFAFEFFNGIKISDDKEIDHLCRVPGCVNPEHLQAVTHQENVLRGDVPHLKQLYPEIRRGRGPRAFGGKCRNGHDWIPENVRSYSGIRRCITCQRDAWKRKYRRKMAALVQS